VHDIETVAAGDLTHRTHPNSTDEIGVLARTFDRMTQNLQGMQELERKQAAQEHQIEVAREVQAALLPEKLPAVPGFVAAAASRTAQRIAGDFYAITDMAGGAKLLAVALLFARLRPTLSGLLLTTLESVHERRLGRAVATLPEPVRVVHVDDPVHRVHRLRAIRRGQLAVQRVLTHRRTTGQLRRVLIRPRVLSRIRRRLRRVITTERIIRVIRDHVRLKRRPRLPFPIRSLKFSLTHFSGIFHGIFEKNSSGPSSLTCSR
jgi:hypothetical protein